jgi:hypothetical protein
VDVLVRERIRDDETQQSHHENRGGEKGSQKNLAVHEQI